MGLGTLWTGLLLPWLVGALWLMAIESRVGTRRPHNRFRQVGYGFFLGYALLSLLIIVCDSWLANNSWPLIMVVLLLAALAAGLAIWLGKQKDSQATNVTLRPPQTGRDLTQTALLAVMIAWILFHLALVAVEVLNQPVFPWDAWQTWVYRAKAWYLSGGMAVTINSEQWIGATSPVAYTMHGASYPPLPSIIPYWAALSLGRWSETLVGLPALLAGLAIGMALYGQCREAGMSRLFSVTACYLLYSTPLFATHVALAGYADLWMAGFTGLGFVALMRGAISKLGFQTVLGVLMLGLALLVKNEAAVWLLAGMLMFAVIKLPWRTLLIAGLALLIGISASFMLGLDYIDLPLLGTLGIVNGRVEIPFIGSFTLEANNIWLVYWHNFFTMGSWNLLWMLVAASLVLGIFRSMMSAAPGFRAVAVFIVILLATQLFIFGFTHQGIWADTYTAINRLPLHFLPALVFAALVVCGDPPDQAGTLIEEGRGA